MTTTCPAPAIERSTGVPIRLGGTATGLVAGGGHVGLTEALDALVCEAADALARAYGMDVTMRFNSNRRSGGAWLRTHTVDAIGANSEIGITAGLRTTHAEARRIFGEDPEYLADMLARPDGGLYVCAYIAGRRLKDPAEANNFVGSARAYLLLEQPDVAAALAFCLAHAVAPVQGDACGGR